MKQRKIMNNVTISKTNDLFDRDIWKTEEFGHKADNVHGIYQLNFRKLRPEWFKQAVKKFVYFQASTKTLSSCFSYVGRLTHFSEFLTIYYPTITPELITREVMIKYIRFIATRDFSISTRTLALVHFRTFHTIMIQENWLPLPDRMLIYPGDLPKSVEHVPKYIPEPVIAQLLMKLHHLPTYMQHLVIVLLETGRRLSEICKLPFDCMEQDEQGDYFLKVTETKMKRSYLIPISEFCIKTIKAQQELVKQNLFKNMKYLFAARVQSKSPHVSGRFVNHSLVALAKDQNIVDEHGKIWQFHSHQFRHTVGTRMINSGVPQTIVQRYLGHESPEMTSRYAHIHDETLKNAFNEYQGKLVDINGKIQYHRQQDEYDEAKWLQHNMMSQALPNGICALPSPQQRCPHANACLTCVNFRTHKKFLPQHKSQLEMTNQIIQSAKTNGWQRQAEMNTVVKGNLETIIKKLENE